MELSYPCYDLRAVIFHCNPQFMGLFLTTKVGVTDHHVVYSLSPLLPKPLSGLHTAHPPTQQLLLVAVFHPDTVGKCPHPPWLVIILWFQILRVAQSQTIGPILTMTPGCALGGLQSPMVCCLSDAGGRLSNCHQSQEHISVPHWQLPEFF